MNRRTFFAALTAAAAAPHALVHTQEPWTWKEMRRASEPIYIYSKYVVKQFLVDTTGKKIGVLYDLD
jgi:hypothetical protein